MSRYREVEGRPDVRPRADRLPAHGQARGRRLCQVSPRASAQPGRRFARPTRSGVPSGRVQGLLQLSREPASPKPNGNVHWVPRHLELQDDRPRALRSRPDAVPASWPPRHGSLQRVSRRPCEWCERGDTPTVRHMRDVPSRSARRRGDRRRKARGLRRVSSRRGIRHAHVHRRAASVYRFPAARPTRGGALRLVPFPQPGAASADDSNSTGVGQVHRLPR